MCVCGGGGGGGGVGVQNSKLNDSLTALLNDSFR